MTDNKTLTIKMNIYGGENSVIPKGIKETLVIEITDGGASFHFNDSNITRTFAARQHNDGVQSVYSARLQKTICKYPNMTKDQIAKHITERLKALGGKVK